MLVVDASAVAELLLCRPAAERVADHLVGHGFDLHAPQLLDVEVLSAFRRALASAQTSLPAPRENFSAYDATYVALAEVVAEEPASLLTADARLARAVNDRTSVPVVLVG